MLFSDQRDPLCKEHKNTNNFIDNPDELGLYDFISICYDCGSIKTSKGEWIHITTKILIHFIEGQIEDAREGMSILKSINKEHGSNLSEYTEEQYLELAVRLKDDWERIKAIYGRKPEH